MDIQVFDLYIEPAEAYYTLQEHVWPLLQPHWSSQKILRKEFTAGYINNMAAYFSSSDTAMDDALVVRLFGFKGHGFPSHELELIKMQLSHQAGTFPKVRAVLRNGIIYECAKGRTLKGEDIRNPTIIRAVTRALAQFHWVDPSRCHLVDMSGNKTSFEVRNDFIKDMTDLLHAFKQFASTSKEKERVTYFSLLRRLEEEVSFLEAYLADLNLPIANAHCGLNNNNIVYNEETGLVTFLDYEYSGYGVPATHDLSFILNYHLWKDFLDKIPKAEGTIQPETRRLWMRSYLERKYELEGRDPNGIEEGDMELWMTAMQITDVCFMVHRAVEKLALLQSKVDLPFLRMAEFTLATYLEQKPRLTSLRQQYLKLKCPLS